MNRPKNLNTPYGQRYLKWIRNKKAAKESYENALAASFAPLSIQEYQQFKQYYFEKFDHLVQSKKEPM